LTAKISAQIAENAVSGNRKWDDFEPKTPLPNMPLKRWRTFEIRVNLEIVVLPRESLCQLGLTESAGMAGRTVK
jgi:hypothetical protein